MPYENKTKQNKIFSRKKKKGQNHNRNKKFSYRLQIDTTEAIYRYKSKSKINNYEMPEMVPGHTCKTSFWRDEHNH